MMPALLEELRSRWPSLGTPSAPPRHGMVIGVDRAAVARITMVLFDDGGAPVAVAKVSRGTDGEAALRREHGALVQLQGSLDEQLRRQVPSAVMLARVGGRLVLVQTALRGQPMTSRYYRPGHTSDRAAVLADFTAAGEWLGAFQAGTGQGGSSAALDQSVRRLASSYRSKVGWSTDEAGLFSDMTDRAAALGAGVPVVGVHGDFWMGNLLVGGAGLRGVVDWELSRPQGHPYSDIFKFPMSYGFYLDRSRPWADGQVPGHPGREDRDGRWRRYGAWPNLLGFGHTWFGTGWFPELVRSFVEQRERQLGLSPVARSVLFPAFLAEQALTLDVEDFRAGYRSTLRAFAAEREQSWLWHCAS